jgi:hypothetical protein
MNLEDNPTWKIIEDTIEPYLHQIFSVGYYYGNRAQGAFHEKPVRQYKNGKCVYTWRSRIQAARAMGVDKSTIGKAIKSGKAVKGSTFKEYDEE